MDVLRAAEPATVEAARDKLRAMAAERAGGDTVPFEMSSAPSRPGMRQATTSPDDTFTRFEAMVLQSFIEAMLPDDAQSVYGGGVAGDMWKSMMAEKLAETMAERGGIGIADRVLGDYYMNGDRRESLSGFDRDPTREARENSRQVSTSMVHEIERQMARALVEGDQSSAASATRTR